MKANRNSTKVNERGIFFELKKEKLKNISLQQNLLLLEVYRIINSGSKNKTQILVKTNYSTILSIKKTQFASSRIFSISEIRNVCIKNRLRFLDSYYYKSPLPYDVYLKCSAFEIELDIQGNFKILTEASNFKAGFPGTQHLIFADLGNGEYYFIAKWGNEYSKFRKFMVLPFRNPEVHLLSIFALSMLLTAITPTRFLTTDPSIAYLSMIRFAFYFWCVIFLAAFSTYYVIGIRKNLNSGEWDSSSFL